VYEVNLSDEARTTAGQLPHHAIKALAELVDVLALQPFIGPLYRGPGSDLRTVSNAGSELLVVWLVIDSQQRLEILRLVWLRASTGDAGAAE
jgi:hypothetical protein